MAHTLSEQTLALAGIFQAAALVHETARSGQPAAAPFAHTIGSLFQLNPESTEAVYGGARGAALGLETVRNTLGAPGGGRGAEIGRYSYALIMLERRLARRPDMLVRIAEGIERAAAQAEIFSQTHPNVLAHLAALYQETISPLGPRIMVRGEPLHLDNPQNAQRIRALLLAGIRSAVLWRQTGGNRLALLVRRNRLLREVDRLLAGPADPDMA
jgi:high frequency lysogenization protein